MGGLAVLFLLGLYLILTVVAIVKVKPVWAKGLVLLAALLIPTADAVYGRYKLKQMCAAEAGLKVYRVAHNVEGFMGYADEEMITKYGYQFVEGGVSTNYYRVSKQNGQIIRDEYVTPKSKFILKLNNLMNEEDIYWRQYYSIEPFISLSEGTIATETQIGFKGGWVERLIAMFSDSGGGSVAVCNNAGLDPKKLILTVLKP
jgi:hypothetical protein